MKKLHPSLDVLLDKDTVFCPAGSDAGTIAIMRHNSLVKNIKENLKEEKIGEEDIEDFIKVITEDFDPKYHFPHDTALCALAVAIHDSQVDFARDFLLELGSIQSRNITMSPHVARLLRQTAKFERKEDA